jgi:hypothetical protein
MHWQHGDVPFMWPWWSHGRSESVVGLLLWFTGASSAGRPDWAAVHRAPPLLAEGRLGGGTVLAVQSAVVACGWWVVGLARIG